MKKELLEPEIYIYIIQDILDRYSMYIYVSYVTRGMKFIDILTTSEELSTTCYLNDRGALIIRLTGSDVIG